MAIQLHSRVIYLRPLPANPPLQDSNEQATP